MPEHSMSTTAIDRIGSLPDEILILILSFVPTKQAIATTILSKRWTNLWCHVPSLDFSNTKVNNWEDIVRFKNFVNTVLHWRESSSSYAKSINSFILDIQFYYSSLLSYGLLNINEWVDDVVESKVQYLSLYLHASGDWKETMPPKLPTSILSCTTLVVLKLRWFWFFMGVPSLLNFPSLKTLHLKDIYFDQRHDFMLLLDGCPVLEDLQLSNIRFNEPYTLGDVNGFQSSSMLRKLNFPSLKTLHLNDIDFDQQHDFMLLLDGCPILEDLQLSNIHFNEPYTLGDVNGFQSSSMLRKLNFPSLKTLHLNDIDFDQQHDFMLLLDGCPVLEDLQLSNIHFNEPDALGDVNGFQSSSMLRKLNFPSLKTLHLNDIDFDQRHDFLLLLEGCPVLGDLQLSNIHFNEPDALCYVNRFQSSSMLRKLNKADITACDCYFPVKSLPNLKFLRMQLSLSYHYNFPIYHYLTHLVLKNDPDIVVQVLQHCPKLQNLELYQKLQGDNQKDKDITRDYNTRNWPDPKVVPSCLTLNLRNCTIRDFEFPGLQRFHILLTKYILKNAKVLETMTIIWWKKKRFKIEKKLHQCPRASATCQLSIY